MTSPDFSYSGTELDILAEVENYYAWILRLIAPHLGERVVEVGAGIGTFSAFLLREPRISELVLIEPARNNLPHLERRFAGEARVRLVPGYLEQNGIRREADALVAVNVLEHVPDDESFLAAARQTLKPGGKLLLFVPAVPAIYGSLDRAFDHFRRYSKPELSRKLSGAGFHSVQLRNVNLPGVLAWLLSGRLLRRTTLKRREVRLYDRWVIPVVERLERAVEPPVGQSILVIATA